MAPADVFAAAVTAVVQDEVPHPYEMAPAGRN